MEGEAVSEAVGMLRRVVEAEGAGPELFGMPSVLRVERLQAACEGQRSRRDPRGPGACCHLMHWMP